MYSMHMYCHNKMSGVGQYVIRLKSLFIHLYNTMNQQHKKTSACGVLNSQNY